MQDAVFNIGRMALLVDALHTGDLQQLALAMEDRLHQPYRMSLIQGMEELIPQPKALGALNVTISGAGPTVLLVSDREKDFSSLLPLLEGKGFHARIIPLRPVCEGAAIIER